MEYDLVFMARQDARGIEELKLERAEEKGMEKGIDIGIEKRNREVAINSIKAGLSNDIIVPIIGLSDHQIDNLRREIKYQNKLSLQI